MKEGAPLPPDEKRKSPRFRASGPAHLLSAQPVPREITGFLVDRSEKGFRLTHHDPDLMAGEKVKFTIDDSTGVALVVWRRILQQHIECGFMIEQ